MNLEIKRFDMFVAFKVGCVFHFLLGMIALLPWLTCGAGVLSSFRSPGADLLFSSGLLSGLLILFGQTIGGAFGWMILAIVYNIAAHFVGGLEFRAQRIAKIQVIPEPEPESRYQAPQQAQQRQYWNPPDSR